MHLDISWQTVRYHSLHRYISNHRKIKTPLISRKKSFRPIFEVVNETPFSDELQALTTFKNLLPNTNGTTPDTDIPDCNDLPPPAEDL